MKKERFVNEALLIRNLPVFICGLKQPTEQQLDKLIDFIEDTMIIEKAKEIEARRAEKKAEEPHECCTDPDGQCTICGKLY